MTVITLSYYLANALAVWLFVITVVFAYFRFDDLIFDALFCVTWTRRWLARRRHGPLTVAELYVRPQKRIAIFVPCWHEAEVIDHMLEYALRHIDYDRFDIFVGVYPNDPMTVQKVRRASRKFPRVHPVINDCDGPTTKAQNLNCVYRAMERIEGDDSFEIVMLHDVEDVIHPLELRLHNHLMPEHHMIQTPVFPLERPWYDFLGWTYADEFARNHLKDMFVREQVGAFVPSAGVGTAFSREALRRVGDEGKSIFPEGSLTEDYLFALRIHKCGLRTIFVNTRLSPEGKYRPATAAAYVSTREFFPNRLKTAVRQKGRWVAGICLQSWSEVGWCGSLANRYALYRDRKGVVSNVVSLWGWIALILAGFMYLWRVFDYRIFVPQFGSDFYTTLLLDFVLLGTLLELLQTACITAWVYGPLCGALSVVRAPLGALVNGLATTRAIYIFVKSRLLGKAMTWSKTTHAFPTEAALAEYHRQLGELLVEGGMTDEALRQGLEVQRNTGGLLGETLLDLGLLSERKLLEALAYQSGTTVLESERVIFDRIAAGDASLLDLRELGVVPIGRAGDRVLVASHRPLTEERVELLCRALASEVTIGLAAREVVRAALEAQLEPAG